MTEKAGISHLLPHELYAQILMRAFSPFWKMWDGLRIISFAIFSGRA
jgi:hypothetical protein